MDISDIQAAKEWDKNKIYIVDTETTGIKNYDEVLSVSIVDIEGNTLFDELVRPVHRKSWPKAQKINGISPDDVKDKKLLVDFEKELKLFLTKIVCLLGITSRLTHECSSIAALV